MEGTARISGELGNADDKLGRTLGCM